MKIIYLSNSKIPSTAANSVHVMRMSNAFAANGHEARLVVPWRGYNLTIGAKEMHRRYGTDGSFKIVKIPLLPTIYGHYLFWILSAIYCKLSSPDVVYGRALFSVYYASLLGIDVHYESHAPENLSPINFPVFKKLLLSKRLKRVVLISDALKEIFIDIHGPSNKFFVAHDGADIHGLFEEKENDTKEFRIGYIGSLYKGRGIDIIIALAKNNPWAVFHVIGGNKEIVEQNKQETSGISNLVFHGFQPPAKIASLTASFDTLLAPYQRKVTILGKGDTSQWMSPLKIFEYMASGVPFITSDLPVLREVLTSHQNCLLCKPDDIKAWEDGILQLKDDPQLRERLAKNAYEDIKNKYSWKLRAQNVIAKISQHTKNEDLATNEVM